jgi:ribosomal-protein-alanine N-acetyltransferase
MIILETKRLILRQFHIFDGEAMDLVFGEPEVMRCGPGVQTMKWVRNWIQGCLESYQKLGIGPWAVVKRSDSAVIGYSGLFHFPDLAGQPEIEAGYRLGWPFWGQGFASEAVLAIREYAFGILCLPPPDRPDRPAEHCIDPRGRKSRDALRETGDARGVYSSRSCLLDSEPGSQRCRKMTSCQRFYEWRRNWQ